MARPRPFTRVLDSIRQRMRPRRNRLPRFVPVLLERLEDRYLMSASAILEPALGHQEDASILWESDLSEVIWSPEDTLDDSWTSHDPISDDSTVWENLVEDPLPSPDGPLFPGTEPPPMEGDWYPGESNSVAGPSDFQSLGSPGEVDTSAPRVQAATQNSAFPQHPATTHKDVDPQGSAWFAVRGQGAMTSTAEARASVQVESPVELLGSAFRISRTPAGDVALEVRYTLSAFGPGGTRAVEGVATVAPAATQVEVPIQPVTKAGEFDAEIVTLTLSAGKDYQFAHPAATQFLTGSPERCGDATLVEAFQMGKSPEAFRTLAERHQPTVLRTCYRVLGNWHDAEDVSQLVFLSLAQHPVRLQATLAGWLRTVARNASIVFLRSRSRRARYEERAARPVLVQPDDGSRDLREELDLALKQVSAPLRDAVRLRYLEGWSQNEAAEILGCPRGTLAQRAAKGVHFLRIYFGASSDEGEANS